MCGTAAEITPVRSVDDQEVGPPGELTLKLQKAYAACVRGIDERWAHWLEYLERAPAEA
jgi:branched-chain amino acid aminotransferase